MAFRDLLGRLKNNLKSFKLFKKGYELTEKATVEVSDEEYRNISGSDRLTLLAESYRTLEMANESAKEIYEFKGNVWNWSIRKEKQSLLRELNDGLEWKRKRNLENFARNLEQTLRDYESKVWERGVLHIIPASPDGTVKINIFRNYDTLQVPSGLQSDISYTIRTYKEKLEIIDTEGKYSGLLERANKYLFSGKAAA